MQKHSLFAGDCLAMCKGQVGSCGLQAKNLENFDHVKKNLSLEDADALAAQEADPMFSIKTEGLSEDMKRVMSKLNTADAVKVYPVLRSFLCCYTAPRSPAHVHSSLM